MTVSLASNALAATSDVQTALGISGSADLVNRLINAASQRIESYLDRKLFYASGIVENVPAYGAPFLRLSRAPISEVTSITFDGVAIPSDEYEIHDADAGVLYRRAGWLDTAVLMGGVVYERVPGTEENLYQVTYKAGWTLPKDGSTYTLPTDIEQACIELAVLLYRSLGRDLSIKSESLLSASVSYGGEASVQTAAAAILEGISSYRRMFVG